MQNLEAPVLTLARAVGARAQVEVTVDRLGPADRDLARLVLNDLVGNALNAGAGDVRVTIAPDGPRVAISVTRRRATDGARGLEDSGHQLGPAGGQADRAVRHADAPRSATGSKTVTACWAAQAA